MAKTRTKFVISGNNVNAIYSDKDRELLDKVGEHQEIRASHVDPLHPPTAKEWLALWRCRKLWSQRRAFRRFGPGHWAVYWLNHVGHWQPCFCDDAGQPFRTKQEAELYEVARLERDFYFTRPKGALHLESLKLEQVENVLSNRNDGMPGVSEVPQAAQGGTQGTENEGPSLG